MNKKIVILGAGAWGTAIAHLLADNHHKVTLWAYEQDVVDSITKYHSNKKYFPDVILPETVTATNDLVEALEHAEWVFEATPVKYLRDVLIQAQQVMPSVIYANWVLLSKGIEQHTNLLPSQILEEIFSKPSYAVVGGPNFATEVAARAFTATTVASPNTLLAHNLASLLANRYFKPFISDDPLGVQVGGAIKNVIALAAGIVHGSGYQQNAQAYLITQGLHEMTMLAEFFGGKRETVYGPSGLGDLILTCTSDMSKNLRAGKEIGKGVTLEQLAAKWTVLPEGINTVQSLHGMIVHNHLVLPLCRGVFDCIFQGESFTQMLEDLHNEQT